MKKVQLKTFTKRFTACALTAAMILSTPSTALAGEFSDNFPTAYSTDENGSHTDSIDPDLALGTDTTTINENIGEITGIIIYGPESISLKPGNETTLSAALLTTGKLDNAAIATLNKQIKWETEDSDIVSIRRDEINPNKCILNPRSSGTVKITATLAKVKYDEFGEIKETGETLEASVDVTVFAPTKDQFAWHIDSKNDKFFVKHTYCLSDYLYYKGSPITDLIGGELNSASDVVTYAVSGSSKVATISGDTLTVKSAGDITLIAMLPDGTEGPSIEISTEAGSPVKKLTASDSKVELDFGEKEGVIPTYDVSVDVETVDGDDTTDAIQWSSSNPAVATVGVDPQKPDDQTRARITATGVGKATITAKSTNGKTAKISVTVKATLIRFTVSTKNEYTWSGKTEELVITRVPAQNKDKLKVTSADKRIKVKSTAGSVTITPANDLKLTDDEDKKTVGEGDDAFDYIEAELTVETTDKNSSADSVDAVIKVRQSDVQIKKVYEYGDNEVEDNENDDDEDDNNTPNYPDIDKKTIKANPNKIYNYKVELYDKHSTPGESAVSWTSSNTKVATVSDNGGVTIVGSGTAKITASSVYAKSKGKYAQSKKTFTIKSTPECESIELKSAVAAYNMSKKKAVTINIKQQLPKKASDEIDWYVNGVLQKKDKKYVTDKKLVLQTSAFKGLLEGATLEVMAVSKTDEDGKPIVYATATVYVIKAAATKVAFAKKSASLSVGQTTEVATKVTGSKTDPVVSYTIDKKGVSVVSAEMKTTADGGKAVALTGIGEGKATITALTASGKKTTLKVTVTAAKKSSSSDSEDE